MLLENCVVLHGPDLEPWWTSRLRVEAGQIVEVALDRPAPRLDAGALVVIPAMCNGHTHLGDACLPDGATGLTLEEAFFRPDGYKYRELRKRGSEIESSLRESLTYLARTGAVVHCDFRESGFPGAQLLRAASEATGVDAVILSQFSEPPFSAAELEADEAPLPESAKNALVEIFTIADGFSESTMNDLTSPAWREIRRLAETAGKLRAIHCLEDTSYRELSRKRTGRGDLARALDLYDPDLVVHLTVANAEEISLLAENGKTAVINPRANANLGLSLPPVRELLEAGINLMLGTDNGMLNSPNLFPELDFTYKLAKSQYGNAVDPDPTAILRMVTSNVGHVLGERFPGFIAEGQPAHLCLLDFSVPHLRQSRHLIASIVTRVTPGEVLATLRNGLSLYQQPGYYLPTP